ncbi:MAG: 23S rRNA (uracil(1939)-C(5))-methyltransferase RlmD, partial [Longicatena sp.]
MIKNEIVEGICENYTHDGQGVVKVNGYPIFVKGVVRNEVVKVQIMRDRKTYAFGRIVEIVKASKHRQKPPCPIYGKCGGCQLQHMNIEAQQDFKRSKVQEVISRVGKLDIEVNPVMEMEHPFSYRNKGQIPVACVQKQVQTGFYRIHSNDIVDMNACMIQSDVINLLMKTIKDDLQQFQNGQSIRHLLIKHAFTTGEAMVVFISRKDLMVKHLKEVYPKLRSVVVNLNRRDDNVILGQEEMVVYGDGFIVDELNGLKFHISSKSFYQVNPIQTKTLYELALENAQLTKEEELLDLYCGVGTISLFMAPHALHVTGIEIVSSAIRDARRNASMNQ